MYARTMSGPPEDKGAGRYSDIPIKDPMEESFFQKYIADPIQESQERRRAAEIRQNNPNISVPESLSIARQERSQSSKLTASEALTKNRNIFGKLRPVPGLTAEQFREYFKDTPQRISKKDKKSASEKVTEDEITRAKANTEAELTSDDLQKALIKNKEEAIAARTAGPPIPPKPKEKGTVENKVLKDVTDAGKGDKKPEDVAKTYMEEFMDMMPEYEGKTGFEKGMDLMKFGMAIAAGESPNAIANISKGFLAMGDTFTKDAAEKRAYEKEIAMAGAQHVLNRQKEDRDTSLQIALKEADLISQENIAELKSLAKKQEKAFDITLRLAENRLVDRGDAVTQASNYATSLKKYNTAIEGKELIAYIAKTALGTKDKKGEALGLEGYAKSAMNKALNALKQTDNKSFENLRSDDPEKLELAQKRLAVSLADILLKESGKTISDRDRQLVTELVSGMEGKPGFITADPDVLIEQFRFIEDKMNKQLIESSREMQIIENGFGRSIVKGSGATFDADSGQFVGGETFMDLLPEGEDVDRARRTAFESGKGSRREDAPVINYKDLIGEDGSILSIDQITKQQQRS